MPLIELINVCFSYGGDKSALNNINMKIEKGSFIALLGANGCGKTTLIQHLNGILKSKSGNVLLNGQDIKKLKDKDVFSTIGIVFQNPDDQLFAFTVSEDVAYGVKNLGIKGKELEYRVDDALKVLNIYDLKNEEVHKLSYGQKKRVALAGILAMQPDVILLDEPTAGLDPMTSSNLIKTLVQLQKEKGVTIVIATHEVDIVPVCCDYVYVLNKGTIALEGLPEEVFKNKEGIRDSNLRLPRIGHLFEILSQRDGIDTVPQTMTISGARKEIKKLLGKD